MQITEEQKRILNSLTCELYRFLVDLEKDSASTEEDRLTINSILESIRTRKGLVKEELAKISHKKKNQLLEDLEKESSDRLKRVGRTFLGFRSSTEHGTAIPLYDYACKFMFQEVSGIETRRDDFYLEFNPDEECS